MKEFHFTKRYFNKLKYEDIGSNLRIVVKETPSLDISEEDYSLRIETHHTEDLKTVHRKYAIEHHSMQDKHNTPHLQFKFHSEEIGTFWLHLDIKDASDYRKAILGFIYKIKGILLKLETVKQGICNEILVLELVRTLSAEGEFLSRKITQCIQNNQLEFQRDRPVREKVRGMKDNPLLIEFLGKENIRRIAETYKR